MLSPVFLTSRRIEVWYTSGLESKRIDSYDKVLHSLRAFGKLHTYLAIDYFPLLTCNTLLFEADRTPTYLFRFRSENDSIASTFVIILI